MGAVHSSVHDIFYFIQDETPGSIPGCVTKPRYLNGSLMHCPVLDAMNDLSADPRFQALRNALLESDLNSTFEIKPVQPEVREWKRLYSSLKNENFQLKAQPPRKRGMGSREATVVELESSNKDAEVSSMRFSAYFPDAWEKGKPRYGIEIQCKHWTTTVKINVLMINLFKLDLTFNCSMENLLGLHPEDEEQFIDMAQILLTPHEIHADSCGPFEDLLLDVLLSSKNDYFLKKGKKLLELRRK